MPRIKLSFPQKGDGQSDEFWLYKYKVEGCPKTYPHNWQECPCAHAGEVARRRDVRIYKYSSQLCAYVKAKMECPDGDNCKFAHHVFEQWLHPDRYKALMCTYGEACTRRPCFFAHSKDELRNPTSEPVLDPCSAAASMNHSGMMAAVMASPFNSTPYTLEGMRPQGTGGLDMRDLHQVPSMYASLPGALERHLGSSMSNSMGGMPLSTSGTGKGLSVMALASKAQGMDGSMVPDVIQASHGSTNLSSASDNVAASTAAAYPRHASYVTSFPNTGRGPVHVGNDSVHSADGSFMHSAVHVPGALHGQAPLTVAVAPASLVYGSQQQPQQFAVSALGPGMGAGGRPGPIVLSNSMRSGMSGADANGQASMQNMMVPSSAVSLGSLPYMPSRDSMMSLAPNAGQTNGGLLVDFGGGIQGTLHQQSQGAPQQVVLQLTSEQLMQLQQGQLQPRMQPPQLQQQLQQQLMMNGSAGPSSQAGSSHTYAQQINDLEQQLMSMQLSMASSKDAASGSMQLSGQGNMGAGQSSGFCMPSGGMQQMPQGTWGLPAGAAASGSALAGQQQLQAGGQGSDSDDGGMQQAWMVLQQLQHLRIPPGPAEGGAPRAASPAPPAISIQRPSSGSHVSVGPMQVMQMNIQGLSVLPMQAPTSATNAVAWLEQVQLQQQAGSSMGMVASAEAQLLPQQLAGAGAGSEGLPHSPEVTAFLMDLLCKHMAPAQLQQVLAAAGNQGSGPVPGTGGADHATGGLGGGSNATGQ